MLQNSLPEIPSQTLLGLLKMFSKNFLQTFSKKKKNTKNISSVFVVRFLRVLSENL